MRSPGAWTLLVLAACGPGLSGGSHDGARDALLASSGDAGKLDSMLRGSVTSGGLLFSDADCASQFGKAGEIAQARLGAFARCLAGLHLQPSKRKSPLADVVLLEYGPGIEVEARVLDEDTGPRLAWIGFESHRDVVDTLPTISPAALENLRTAGDRNGPIDALAIDQLGLDLNVDNDVAFLWMKVCLDAQGKVTAMRPREASSLTASRVFTAAAASWQFRPFVAFGQPIPVCSLVEMVYPPQMMPKEPEIPVPLAKQADEPTMLVSLAKLNRQRLHGDSQIVSEDDAKLLVQQANVKRAVGAFQFCLDATGHVASVQQLQSTGIAQYDQQIVAGLRTWVYSPYLEAGKPVGVCSAATFASPAR